MTTKNESDASSDEDFDQADIEALAAMATEDETDKSDDEEAPEPEFRNGSPVGALMQNVQVIDTGKKPQPIEYDDEPVPINNVPREAVVICKDDNTNWLYRAVVYLMSDGTLVYTVVADKEQAWKLALRMHGNKKTLFKKKNEDATLKRSVPNGKAWSDADFASEEPLFCTPSATHKSELRKASAKAAKLKSSPLAKPPQTANADASGPASSPKPLKPTKPASTDAPKKPNKSAKKRLQAETISKGDDAKRRRLEISDTRTLTATTDHPVWEFVDAAMVAMADSADPIDV